jgi:hypothetical protein
MLLNFLVSLLFAGLAASQCNGNTALCGRQYSSVSFVGTHDSAFVGILPTDNQLESVTDQLDAGIRFLQAQTHIKNSALELCHTSCLEEDVSLPFHGLRFSNYSNANIVWDFDRISGNSQYMAGCKSK